MAQSRAAYAAVVTIAVYLLAGAGRFATLDMTENQMAARKRPRKSAKAKSSRAVRSSSIKQRVVASDTPAFGNETRLAATKSSGNKVSKKEMVLRMLQEPEGTSISAITAATGWQEHSVRGFLAAVVKKKLQLNLVSRKIGGERIYRIEKIDAAS
jgi:hypothetical protein